MAEKLYLYPLLNRWQMPTLTGMNGARMKEIDRRWRTEYESRLIASDYTTADAAMARKRERKSFLIVLVFDWISYFKALLLLLLLTPKRKLSLSD